MPTLEQPRAERGAWDHTERSRLELLLRCLAFDAAPLTPTCRDWDLIIASGLTTGLLPDVAERLRQHQRDVLSTAHGGGERARQLDALMAGYRYRRRSQRQLLLDAARAWNVAGLEPVLSVGVREAWLDEPFGHGVHEFCVLVDPCDFAAAGHALRGLGFTQARSLVPNWYRRVSNWSHPRNYYVKVHALGWNRHIERLLPAKLIRSECTTSAIDGARAGLLPDWLDAIHSMLHHRFVGVNSSVDSVAPQALYQFALTRRRLTGDDIARLQAFLALNPTIAVLYKTWLEASESCFGRISGPISQDGAIRHVPNKSEAAAGGKKMPLIHDRSGWRIALPDRGARLR